MAGSEINVTATLIWYYYICHREVWLMARQITPDQDNSNLEIGRVIQDQRYAREKKEVDLGGLKVDILKREGGELVIAEVKKSSRFKESARMQLAFYIKSLKTHGVIARGELRFPEEKQKEAVILDEQLEQELDRAEREILRIAYLEQPPRPEKIQWCKRCAYNEFCWT
ncbi:CRISPR-associated Cas4 family exonuclease [Hydrogenispora ethanolica]|uniref:CRISPR-associated exonuclease Cas4 n=1 Tax=Hydrogenispora ethanolica TaxID=1082276 RepID=A0A4R1RQ92_HYDET|nr:CRISPR-associated protein Cas4 [Hydrogenispora ethanolica]TCL68464.1 CRISPR-associated Cas4 family exonuclease [Hydrogenispora ethanolica]